MFQGANSYGQLGQNHQDDKIVPEALHFVPGNLEFLSGGGGHSLVIFGLYIIFWIDCVEIVISHLEHIVKIYSWFF